MFDLSFYELIKCMLNFKDNSNGYLHKFNTARTITWDMIKYVRFSWLVLYLTKKEDTNLSNIERYMGDYFEYFI